jgi:hypothetical protein
VQIDENMLSQELIDGLLAGVVATREVLQRVALAVPEVKYVQVAKLAAPRHDAVDHRLEGSLLLGAVTRPVGLVAGSSAPFSGRKKVARRLAQLE